MPASQTISKAQQLQGAAMAIAISALFAALWGINGSLALAGNWRWLAAGTVVLITIAFFVLANRFRQSATQLPAQSGDAFPNPFRTNTYRLAVAAEIIAIPIAGRVLSANGYGDAIMPVIAIIVGLHFFALIAAFHSWHFAWVGAAFCLLALASFALPAAPLQSGVVLRNAVVGFGCALILWAGVLPLILAIRRQAAL